MNDKQKQSHRRWLWHQRINVIITDLFDTNDVDKKDNSTKNND